MNKKGFTLVELLAVIVILAIILAIAVPSITGILNSAKRSAFEADVKLIIKGIEYKMLEKDAGTIVPINVIPGTAPTVEAPFYMTT
ncbi:MAG: prepilin-type N-terminal cleavage/methylation domain-containing protein, partial [Bacilli bacterium]